MEVQLLTFSQVTSVALRVSIAFFLIVLKMPVICLYYIFSFLPYRLI